MSTSEAVVATVDSLVLEVGHNGDPGIPRRANRRPEWIVDVGQDCRCGLVTDDGCFLVLYPQPDDSWRPGTHIPRQVAERIGQLVASGALN